MDFLIGLGIFLLLIAVVFTPLFGLYYIIKYLWDKFVEPHYGSHIGKINTQLAEQILSQKFGYYQKLLPDEKVRFLKRLCRFIEEKEFSPGGGLVVTDEMVVLISASAIQLTFGLDEFMLYNFSRIVIYPKEFYSVLGKHYHKGETNLAGVIALSWYHFQEGYNNPSDNLNLGLHEMGHALRFDKFRNDHYDLFFSEYFEKWHTVAHDEFMRLKRNENTFFRAYGGTNINEFFSVCIEYFFESPLEFRQKHPDIYKHLSVLLNQDPASGHFAEGERYQEPPVILSGEPVYTSGYSTKYILSLVFVTAFWIFITIIINMDGFNFQGMIWMGMLLMLGYSISQRNFKKIRFYSKGIEIFYLFPSWKPQYKQFTYDQLIAVEFTSSDISDTGTLEVVFLEEGKIKRDALVDSTAEKEMEILAKHLENCKVPVKINDFWRN
jgi:Mlc titration factor MtfA (ptsG expression regulator)